MKAPRINQTMSAYKQLNGPYDWNRYPLVPLGCKAVINEDDNTRGSWASRGVDGWYLRPSIDHYKCSLFHVPKMQAYRISGLAELSPQHCQIPNMSLHQYLCALTVELWDKMAV